MALLKLTDWNSVLHVVLAKVGWHSGTRVERVTCVDIGRTAFPAVKLSNVFMPNPGGLRCGKSTARDLSARDPALTTGMWQQGHKKKFACSIPFPTSLSGIPSTALKLKRRKQRHQAAVLPRAYEE